MNERDQRRIWSAGVGASALLFALLASVSAQGQENAPPPSSAKGGHVDFVTADKDADGSVNRGEAAASGLVSLMQNWQQADENGDLKLSRSEYTSYLQSRGSPARPAPGQKPELIGRSPQIVIGKGQFASPETALWDDQMDVYLVSNVNGGLTALDGNGFISRITPDGRIMDLKWISGSQPGVTLHGPKGMTFSGGHLVVADVNAVRYFDRVTGKPVRSVPFPDAYMLNDLAEAPDGTLYVTDTGSETAEHPGAVYRVTEQGPVVVAKGRDLDRPDGLAWHEGGLLVTPFGSHARNVYKLTPDGKRSTFARMPAPQLDGLLELPDGSYGVTSWKGNSVYRLPGPGAEPDTIAARIPTPAQIGYDKKRNRLLVPVLQENELRLYTYGGTSSNLSGQSGGTPPAKPATKPRS